MSHRQGVSCSLGLDREPHLSSTPGIPTPAGERQGDLSTQVPQGREKDVDEVMDRGAHGDVGAPPDRDGGGFPGHEQRRQEGLGHQGDGPGAAGFCRHVEKVAAARHGPGAEGKLPAAELGPLHFRPGDPGQGHDPGEVLGPEPRFGAAGPDIRDVDRLPQEGRQGKGGPDNPPASLPVRAIQVQHSV